MAGYKNTCKAFFKAADVSADGSISKKELSSIFKSIGDPIWLDTEIDALFKVWDKKGDGRLQYEEFLEWVFRDEERKVNPAIEEAMTKMFKLYDLDNSGFITIDESLAMDRAFSEACGFEFDEAKSRETFSKGDTNKDAKVTVEEFVADMKRTAAKNNLSDDALLQYVQMTNEMLTMNLGKATISLDDALTALFTIQDIDRSGFITLDESLKMDKLFSEVSGVPFDAAETKETFTQTDTNQDGKVSLEEFKAFFKKTASEAGMDEKAQLGLVRQTNDMMILAKELVGRTLEEEWVTDPLGTGKKIKTSSEAPPCVVLIDPGEDLDDEMSLILLTALEARGLLQCKGVITTLAPSELRAQLARGILDELGMNHVPVARGSDGGAHGKNEAFQKHPRMSSRAIALDSESLLEEVFNDVPNNSLMIFILASLKDAAAALKTHEELFVAKVRAVVIMGGVKPFESDEDSLLEPDTAHNNEFHSESSSFFYRRCQQLGVPLVVLTRVAAYACQMPKSIYDDLAATGSVIGQHLQSVQKETIERLWRRACAAADAPEREGLPARCDQAWFLTTFCGGAKVERTGADSCWDLIISFNMYDPLAILGGLPGVSNQFFDFEAKTVHGVTHLVAGVSKEKNGVRDATLLQKYLYQALIEGLKGYELKQPSTGAYLFRNSFRVFKAIKAPSMVWRKSARQDAGTEKPPSPPPPPKSISLVPAPPPQPPPGIPRPVGAPPKINESLGTTSIDTSSGAQAPIEVAVVEAWQVPETADGRRSDCSDGDGSPSKGLRARLRMGTKRFCSSVGKAFRCTRCSCRKTKTNLVEVFRGSVVSKDDKDDAASSSDSSDSSDDDHGDKSEPVSPGLPRMQSLPGLHYSWRTEALCTNEADNLTRKLSAEELRKRIQKVLRAPKFRSSPPSGREYVSWMLRRVKMLQQTGGPRMRVVWWKTLVELGRMPRWPDDKCHILDVQRLLEKWLKKCDSDGRVDYRFLYLRMLSHRWERPHFCEACLKGKCPDAKLAHPDTSGDIKAKVLGRWGKDSHDIDNIGLHSPEDLYLWIDFPGINQDDPLEKSLGIEMLPLYVACCGNGMIFFLPDDGGYEDRAWTSVERVMAYTFCAAPVMRKIDASYIEGGTKWRPKKLSEDKPEYWHLDNDGQLHIRLQDPANGQLTNDKDIGRIQALMEIVKSTPPIDFFGVKSHLEFGKTLARVEDTCSRRKSSIMRRGKTMPLEPEARKTLPEIQDNEHETRSN